MDILLLNPPWQFESSRPPLGIAILAAVIREKGYEVDILDMGIEKDPYGKLASILDEKRPSTVGVTMNTSMFNEACDVLKFVKKFDKNIDTVVGGPHPTALPHETMRIPEIDAVINGEGEISIIDFMKGKRGILPIKPVMNLDSLPFPARDLLELDKYTYELKGMKATPVICSRGCPFRCLYCSKAVFGSRYRIRSVENVIEEIRQIVDVYKIKGIIFNDDLFTQKHNWVKDFCNTLIREKIDIVFRCESRVNTITKPLLKILKRAGCYDISFGIESGNQQILNKIKKDITLEQAENAVRWTKEVGIHTTTFFMIGLPGDNRKTIRDTINFAKKIDSDELRFSQTTPYPGTELYEIAVKEGYILSRDWSKYYAIGPQAKTNPVMKNPNLTQKELGKLLRRAYMEFTISKMLKFNKSSWDWFKFIVRGFLLGLRGGN
jgi:magnesium-protoporphyrin IX monomethyl ester (oxidative) cyclase